MCERDEDCLQSVAACWRITLACRCWRAMDTSNFIWMILGLQFIQCGGSSFLHDDSASIWTRFMQLHNPWNFWISVIPIKVGNSSTCRMLQMGWVTCTINDSLESHSKSSATFGVFTQSFHMKLLSPEGLNNTVINNKGSSWGEGFKWGEGRLSDSFTANFVSASQTKVSWGPLEPSSSFAWMIVSSTRQELTDSPNTLQRRLRWLLRAQG